MALTVICVYTVEDYATVEQPLPSGICLPFGLATIAAVLKAAGHNVKLLVFTPGTSLDDTLVPIIDEFRPQLFCFTAVSTQFPAVSRIASRVKELDPSIFVVVGGPHASLAPEEIFACPDFDGICIGEGETGVLELAKQLEGGHLPKMVPNFWLKQIVEGSVEKNPPVPFLNDLDQLPFIDREFWRPWIKNPYDQPAVLLGRGCPNHCTYCSNHALRHLAPGQYVRFRSPRNVVAEIKEIAQDPRITRIYLEVETITANLNYCHELCQELSSFNRDRQKPVKFSLNFSLTGKLTHNPQALNQVCSALKEAGVETLNLGLESGSERIRNEVLRRPRYTNEEIISFCNKAKRYGLKINMYVLLGLPGETLADFRETVEVTRRCTPETTSLSIFYPYPGTSLYFQAREQGLFDRQTLEHKHERHSVVLKLPGFSKGQILRQFILFNYKVFQGRWPLTRRVMEVLQRASLTYPCITPFYAILRRGIDLFRTH